MDLGNAHAHGQSQVRHTRQDGGFTRAKIQSKDKELELRRAIRRKHVMIRQRSKVKRMAHPTIWLPEEDLSKIVTV